MDLPLGMQTSEAVAGLRDLENARLDALQLALWDAAMTGDVEGGPVTDPQTKIQSAPARAEDLGQHVSVDRWAAWSVFPWWALMILASAAPLWPRDGLENGS